MKKIWSFTGIVLAGALALSLGGCKAKAGPATPQAVAETTVEETKAAETNAAETAAGATDHATRIFRDSAGREVEIPANINKIAPSGPLAQIVLYTIAPDKLSGLASDFSDEAKQYISEAYWGLPKFGQFYGKNASLNMEALVKAGPDIIVDIGEAKKTVKEDMDALQQQLGIPVVFIEATLENMDHAYDMLGDLTGEKTQGMRLSAYSVGILNKCSEISSAIPEEEKKTVYFALGGDGLSTNAKGSIHADVIEKCGGKNAAEVEKVSSGGGSQISFEQLMLWQPDVIIVDSQSLYDTVMSDSVWKSLTAVAEGKVYKIPTAPYSFMSSPPSVNRMIGLSWLGNLLYPEKYNLDIRTEVSEFYKVFYHIELTEPQLDEILNHSL